MLWLYWSKAEIKLKANYQIYLSASLPLACHASQCLVCSCISGGRMIPLKCISRGAQYVTLQKYFSHPSLVIYCFATLQRKLKLGQPIGGGGLLIANHLDESLWWASKNHWTLVRSYLLHSFLQCTAHSPATANCAVILSQNHFPEPNRGNFDFSSSNYIVQDHILSTAGDALKVWFFNMSFCIACMKDPLG